MGWGRAPRACTTQKGRVTGEIVGAGGLRWLLRALEWRNGWGRGMTSGPCLAVRERGRGIEGAGVGLAWAKQDESEGVGQERWIFPFYFQTHFQEHLQIEF